ISNPVTNADVDFTTFNVPANTITIFVGMRPLSGSTLGTGGPGSGSNLDISFGGSNPNLATAVHNVENASNAEMPRGAGPIISSLSGTVGGTAYTVNYGSMFGNLWFDD